MEEHTQQKVQNQYLVPLAIIIAGLFIAGAVFVNGTSSNTTAVLNANDGTRPVAQPQEQSGSTDAVRPVTEEDHIKGNPNAEVIVVEYSDYECPFCKRFHDTMNTIMDEQGKEGNVAWVFRHFPLEQLHPKNAAKVAVASECAAEQGGNEMFWKFTDRFMELTPSNDRTDLSTVLPQIYTEIGLNTEKMNSCIESGKYQTHVEDDLNNAVATGGRGTPWSIVIAPNGKTFPLNGAQPLTAVKQLIELVSQEK